MKDPTMYIADALEEIEKWVEEIGRRRVDWAALKIMRALPL